MDEERLTYERLVDIDMMLPRVIGQIRNGSFRIDQRSGKIVSELPPGYDPDLPWVIVPGEQDRNCRLWAQVYFEYYRIIPRACFNCYKIVHRPRTLKDLFAIRKLQKDLGVFGKCGMETRAQSTWKGLWGAFWYVPLGADLKEAQALHKQVERAVHRALGVGEKVIMKRACTEMEDAVGSTDQWTFPEVQHTVEDYLNMIWDIPLEYLVQPDFLKIRIFRRWIEYAWENRDPSVEEFVENVDKAFGIVPTARYEESSGVQPRELEVPMEDKGRRPSFSGLSDYL